MKIYTLLILLIAVSTANSNELPEYLSPETHYETKGAGFEHKHENCAGHGHLLSGESAIIRKNFDVKHYDLWVDFYSLFEANPGDDIYEFSGVNNIYAEFTGDDTISSIKIDASDFKIDSILFNDELFEDYNYDGRAIIADISGIELNRGDEFKLTVYYNYSGDGRSGFRYYTSDDTNYDLLYTMSEPDRARDWMPSNDLPYERASNSFHIRVPDYIKAGANGLLDSTTTELNEDPELPGAVTFHWSDDVEIPSYLMVITASEYELEIGHWNKYGSEEDSIPVYYYYWPEDKDRARNAYMPTNDMLTLFSELFGTYPYKKYGIVPCEPYPAGGMENNTLITVHRNWLGGNSIFGYAHEAAHHWFGNNITCATWNDIWINEGGASWCEGMFNYMASGDKQNLYYYLANLKSRFFEAGHYNQQLYGIPKDDIFGTYYTVVYYKGAWIYQMLYEIYGDDFIGFLNYLLEEYEFQSIETKDFREALKTYLADNGIEEKLVSIDDYFDMWVFNPGLPLVDLTSSVEMQIKEDENSMAHDITYKVKVNVKQATGWGDDNRPYITPMDLILPESNSPQSKYERINLVLDSAENSYEFEVDYMPVAVNVSSWKGIIRTRNNNFSEITSVEPRNENEFSIYPNPVESGNSIRISLNNFLTGSVKVINSNGEIVKTINNPAGNEITISTAGLSPGLYLLQATGVENIRTGKFIVR